LLFTSIFLSLFLSLSLHDALPIYVFLLVDESHRSNYGLLATKMRTVFPNACYIGFTGTPLMRKEKNTMAKFGKLIHKYTIADGRSEEHSSELQSRFDLVCRLLLEK